MRRTFSAIWLALALATAIVPMQSPPVPNPEPPPTPAPAPPVSAEIDAKAVVTLDNGEPIPAEWPAGINVPLSYANSVVGDRGLKSVRVIVKPDWLQKFMRVHPATKTIDLPVGTSLRPVTITIKVAYHDTFDEATYLINVVANPDDPSPPPPPPAPPGPAPAPTPPPVPPAPTVVGHLFASYIADASALNSTQAAMKQEASVEAGIVGMDASYRWYQSDQPELAKANIIAYANEVGLPCLLIQQADGKVVAKLKSPTPAEVVAKVKALRGKP